mgnify:CR=1 FL=1
MKLINMKQNNIKKLLLIGCGCLATYYIGKAIIKSRKESKEKQQFQPQFFEYCSKHKRAEFNYNDNAIAIMLGTSGWNTIDYLETQEDFDRSQKFIEAINSFSPKYFSFEKINSCWQYIKFYNIQEKDQMIELIKDYVKKLSNVKKHNKIIDNSKEKTFGSDMFENGYFTITKKDIVRYFIKVNE